MLPYFSFTEINLGVFTLQVWGLFVALGFVAALAISLKEARKMIIDEEIIWDVMAIALVGMIVGGRIFYVLSNPEKNVVALADTHSGFSLAGGMIMAGALSLVYLKAKRHNFKNIADLLTPGFIVSLILVRIGCLLVNDHIGKITTLPWGMEFTDGTMRHPVALYEIIFLIFLLGVIYRLKSKQKRDGYIFLVFAATYAIFRIGADFLRCDDLSFCDLRFYGLTLTQWVMSGCILLLTFVLVSKTQED
ncbi:MAG TPA: prolipoprotein diacylglyceryl transferase family protein [Methylococcales bacterium]